MSEFIRVLGYRKGGDNKYPIGDFVIFHRKHLIGWKYLLDNNTIEVIHFKEEYNRYTAFYVRSSEFDNGTHSSYQGLWITPDAWGTLRELLLTMRCRVLNVGEEFVEKEEK